MVRKCLDDMQAAALERFPALGEGEEDERVRVVWSVANDRVSLVDFGEEDRSMEFLRDRVVRVSI